MPLTEAGKLAALAKGRETQRQARVDSGPKLPRKHGVHDGSGGTVEVDNYTRAKAIKTMCSLCMPDDHPKNCTSTKCPLYPYRGKVLI